MTGKVFEYSGGAYAEHPREIVFKGKKYRVTRWYPLGKILLEGVLIYKFEVETEEGAKFKVEYIKEEDRWIVTKKS